MRVDAFAKLTLFLHITGVRADGYHEIDATMVTVSEPHDTLTIEPAPADLARSVGPVRRWCPARRVESGVARGRRVRRLGRDPHS